MSSKRAETITDIGVRCQFMLLEKTVQGCVLRKILGSPLGTQPCRLGYPEIKLSHPNEKKIKNELMIN